MTRYVAFLRGINVGGNALIKMPALKSALETAGFHEVSTYIQSGNVLFSSDSGNLLAHASAMRAVILKSFDLDVDVVVFSGERWKRIVADAPSWWGVDPEWKHNVLIMTAPYEAEQVFAEIGELKPGLENLQEGDGVFYQSIHFKSFSRTAGGKLASRPVYKKMTVRNYNTASKLAKLLQV